MKNEQLRKAINEMIGDEPDYALVVVDNTNKETYVFTGHGTDVLTLFDRAENTILGHQSYKAQQN